MKMNRNRKKTSRTMKHPSPLLASVHETANVKACDSLAKRAIKLA